MDRKNFLLSTAAVFVVYAILDFLVHGVLLADAYEATASVWRPETEMMSMVWIMWLATLLWSFIFVYIFGWQWQGKGVGEGIRFGFCIGLFVVVPMAYSNYAVLPVPHSLALSWFVYGMVQVMVCGAILALVYRPGTTTGTG